MTATTLPYLPGYGSIMIPSFHCALFRSSSFMTTTSLTLTSRPLSFCFNLCLMRIHLTYAFLHLFHTASFTFVYTFVSFGNHYIQYMLDLCHESSLSNLKLVNLVLKLETGFFLLYKLVVWRFILSLYLWVTLLASSSLTLLPNCFIKCAFHPDRPFSQTV